MFISFIWPILTPAFWVNIKSASMLAPLISNQSYQHLCWHHWFQTNRTSIHAGTIGLINCASIEVRENETTCWQQCLQRWARCDGNHANKSSLSKVPTEIYWNRLQEDVGCILLLHSQNCICGTGTSKLNAKKDINNDRETVACD